jgi:hypothetical protein
MSRVIGTSRRFPLPLLHDGHALGEVDVGHAEGGELRDPQPRLEEELHHEPLLTAPLVSGLDEPVLLLGREPVHGALV